MKNEVTTRQSPIVKFLSSAQFLYWMGLPPVPGMSSVVGYLLSVIGYRLLVIGSRFSITDYRAPTTDNRPATGG